MWTNFRRVLGSLTPGDRESWALLFLGALTLAVLAASGGLFRSGPGVVFLSGPDPSAYDPVFDVNSASEGELVLVEGVGPAIARRIIEDREKNGPFRRLEDLARVKGVGEKTVARISRYFRIGAQREAAVSPGKDTAAAPPQGGEAVPGPERGTGGNGTNFD